MQNQKTTLGNCSLLVRKPQPGLRLARFLFGSFLRKTASFLIVLLSILSFSYYFNAKDSQSANYTFNQTNWSGGSTANVATHASNQTGWNQNRYKLNLITTPNAGADVSYDQTGVFNINFDTEGQYVQQDATSGTDFSAGKVTLHPTLETNTKLLLHADGAEGSTAFTDSSSSGKTVTASGDAKMMAGNQVAVLGNSRISTAETKFGSSSAYLDGTGDYLTVPKATATPFDGLSTVWTIDAWIKSNDIATTVNGVFDQQDTLQVYLGNGNARVALRTNAGGGFWYDGSPTAYSFQNNTWYHVAVVMNGTSLVLYINGQAVSSVTVSGVPTQSQGSTVFRVGMTDLYPYDGSGYFLKGYVDEVRISKGIARWTSNFTPFTEAYTTDSYTRLLLHADGANASTNFLDSSNFFAKFNTAAYFDGSGDYLNTPTSDDFEFGSGDFTIEAWVKPSTLSGIQTIYDRNSQIAGNSKGIRFRFNASYGLEGYLTVSNTSYTIRQNSLTGWDTLNWHHVAMTRNGNSLYLWLDGTQVATMAWTYAFQTITKGVYVGIAHQDYDGSKTEAFSGSIDELRVSKGIARWTANFTPPTSVYGTNDYPTTPYYVTTTDVSRANPGGLSHINSLAITQTAPANTNIKYLVSFDNRATWKYWNGSSWQVSSLASINTDGVVEATLEGLSTADWESSGGFVYGATNYLNFAASLSTTSVTATPELDNIAINYTSYSQNMVSSVFDTGSTSFRPIKVQWTENLPSGSEIKLRIRTSPDNVTWTDYLGPDGTMNTFFTDPAGGEAIPNELKTGGNDQYFQYQVFFTSAEGGQTPTLSDLTVTYSDSALPSITGVTEGQTYLVDVSPTTANGTATLNGSPYTSGTPITATGDYTLSVTDGSTTVTVHFSLLREKTVDNPTPEKLEEDVDSGIITIDGLDPTATAEATITIPYTLTTGNATFVIPEGTLITPSEDPTLDITALTTANITESVQTDAPTSKGAIRIGIPGTPLEFNQPVSVTFTVHPHYNGGQLTIYSRPDGGSEEDWTYHGTCAIADSQCTFSTLHATEFTGNFEVSNSPEPTDVNLDINATITISCDESVTMNPITGTGRSTLDTNNDSECNIRTNNSSGYNLTWAASGAMQNANNDQIAAFTASSATPETWTINNTDSEWGAHLMSTSTTTSPLTWGTDDYAGNWLDVPTETRTVASRSTETSQSGDTEIIRFGAEVGSAKFQPSGSYDIDVIFTAVTN